MKTSSLLLPVAALFIIGAAAYFSSLHQASSKPEAPCALESASEFTSHGPCAPELKALLERQDGCEHFAGEEAYDEERAAFLKQSMAELKCDTLGADKTALVKKYIAANDEDALSLLVEYERYAHGQLVEGMTIDNPDIDVSFPDARILIIESRAAAQ